MRLSAESVKASNEGSLEKINQLPSVLTRAQAKERFSSEQGSSARPWGQGHGWSCRTWARSLKGFSLEPDLAGRRLRCTVWPMAPFFEGMWMEISGRGLAWSTLLLSVP